jgi:hypothetical protein
VGGVQAQCGEAGARESASEHEQCRLHQCDSGPRVHWPPPSVPLHQLCAGGHDTLRARRPQSRAAPHRYAADREDSRHMAALACSRTLGAGPCTMDNWVQVAVPALRRRMQRYLACRPSLAARPFAPLISTVGAQTKGRRVAGVQRPHADAGPARSVPPPAGRSGRAPAEPSGWGVGTAPKASCARACACD